MCLVSGDQENLSSMPRGMKTISELQDIERKQRPDGLGRAGMWKSLHSAHACWMDTLTHQPTQTGVWQEKKIKDKAKLFSCGTRVLRPAHGHTLWEHNVPHRQPLPPALWWQADSADGREGYKIRRRLWYDSLTLLLHASVRVCRCKLTGNTHWHTLGSKQEHGVVWRDSCQTLAPAFPHTHLYLWLLLSAKRIKSAPVQPIQDLEFKAGLTSNLDFKKKKKENNTFVF